MKKRKLRSVLALMLATSVLFGTTPGAIACLVAVDVTIPASGCDCEDPELTISSWSEFWDWLSMSGECTGNQHSSITYTGSFRDAVTNESGYGSLTFTLSQVGTQYPCIADFSPGNYALCAAGAALCGAACGTTWIGCLCIPGFIDLCSWCAYNDCVADTNNPQAVNRLELSAVACGCTG